MSQSSSARRCSIMSCSLRRRSSSSLPCSTYCLRSASSIPEIYIPMHKSSQDVFIGSCSKTESTEKWEQVISLAKDRVKTLEIAIQAFERFKAKGEPFPGERH